MTQINIQFSRFSAFYTPLIATISGGFLAAEGLDGRHSVATASKSAIASLLDGSVHVVQSAPSQGFAPRPDGQAPAVVHFAQINETDGFFVAGRVPDSAFTWSRLAGKKVLVDHAAQPKAMFQFGCHRMGLDYDNIEAIDAGGPDEMEAAFRAGTGDYVQLQGPAPQQLQHDGVGHVVASVGKTVGLCAFSSLAATPAWLETDMAAAFTRAYRKARAYTIETPAADIARAAESFFPNIAHSILTETIATYQAMDCWTSHLDITRAAFDASVEIFTHAGLVTAPPTYEDIVVPVPGA